MSYNNNDPVFEQLSPADREQFLRMVRKGISRRDFMSYMMAAGATATASGTFDSTSSASSGSYPRFLVSLVSEP